MLRRRLCRVALGQDLPTLETTPVGELRRPHRRRRVPGGFGGTRQRVSEITQSLAIGIASVVHAAQVWWPAGVAMIVLRVLLVLGLARPARPDRPGPHG